MQIRRSLATMIAAWIAAIAAPPLLSAQIGVQRERNVPTVYAVTNARIVPVSGAAIAKGTIVIRDGVITAVGANVPVPADARVIDASGLTVYPGFIDANSSIGYSASPAATIALAGQGARGRAGGSGAAQQGAPAGAPNSLKPVGLQPELAAADLVTPDDFDGPHSAGITAALTVPATGIFRGLSAMITLNGSTSRGMIVKAPIAEHIGFTARRGAGYPGSLLGVFAALRQQLLDAQHYAAEQAAYARNPRTGRRPEHDPSLEALQPVLARQIPVVMEANSVREIERALNLAKEFGLRAIISGGEEADQLAPRLKAENVPVLLSLNYPRRPTASPDADPEPLRTLRARVEAPALAGKLARAGVRFAFEDGRLNAWPDFLANIRRTVENGLSSDEALRALTLSPAEILGVGDRLGTIETGKIANLTISRGDLFSSDGARVSQLFIDGAPVELRVPTTGAGALMANGTWTITVTTDEGERPVTVAITQVGEELRGTIQGALGSAQIENGSIDADGSIRFSASVTMGGGTEEATFSGAITSNVVRGTMSIVGHPQATFVGTKPEGQGGGRRGRTPRAAGRP